MMQGCDRQKLTSAEVAELETRQEGPLPAETRRALRHGAGDQAQRAEALSQSQVFDDLAKAAARRRAQLRASNSAEESRLSGDLTAYRSAGLLWQARIRD